ncbi:MAG: hypothetical protein IH623_28430, partial [Verrucomicrobia bacterium]|nr:hypothetical protein [Verrucomicrobiota bacterium]
AATYTHQQSKPSRIQELIREAGVETLRPELLQDCSRKTIELMIGLAALNTFDEVFLEDPEESNSKDPNPDIIIRSTSENFGIACKSLNSLNRVNLRERIEEGLEQIDRAIACGKIDKRRGIVLLDISPLLNHDALYIPSKNRVWPLNHVPQILLETINDTLGKMLGAGPSSTLNETVGDLFKKHQAAPCVLVYAHTVMIASSVESTAPRYMKAMKLLFAGDHSKVKVFSERLNRALHCQ